MRLILVGEQRIRLIYDDSLELDVESPDPLIHYSPLHMLAASLATCTMAVMLAWADTIRLSTDGLALTLDWEYVEDPYRVGEYRFDIEWPGLPENRHGVALKMVERCTVEATLRHPPTIETRLR